MSKQRAKGTRFESAVVAVMAQRFPYVERRALRGKNDAGDLAGLPIPVECKNTRTLDLAGACREAETAAARLGAPGWAAVFKRPRRNERDAYAVVPLWLFAEMLWAWDQHGTQLRLIDTIPATGEVL